MVAASYRGGWGGRRGGGRGGGGKEDLGGGSGSGDGKVPLRAEGPFKSWERSRSGRNGGNMKTTAFRGRRRRGGRKTTALKGRGLRDGREKVFWWAGEVSVRNIRTKYAGRCFWGGGDFWGKSKKTGWNFFGGVGGDKKLGGDFFGNCPPKNCGKIAGKNFVTNIKEVIFGKFPQQNSRGGVSGVGGGWGGGLGCGINAGEVKKKYVSKNVRGGVSVGGVLNPNKIWGESFFGGGAFRKSFGGPL